MSTMHNLVTLVNKSSIQKNVIKNGRSHTVVTSKTLPFDVVMNGILYPKDQILANYQKLEGTPAPLGHPQNSQGEFISAKTPEGINLSYVGAWNTAPKIVGNRVELETWIDNEVASRTAEGKELLDRIDRGEPISTSVAVLANRIDKKGANYSSVADIIDMDHNAILLNEPPAAGIDQGVGLLVNTSEAVEAEHIEQVKKNDIINVLKGLFTNQTEVEKMEKDQELHDKIDRLNESIGELVSILKTKEEKKEEEVLANSLNEIKNILLKDHNEKLSVKRTQVAEFLGNSEAVASMDESALDALISKFAGQTANILPNSATHKADEVVSINDYFGGNK